MTADGLRQGLYNLLGTIITVYNLCEINRIPIYQAAYWDGTGVVIMAHQDPIISYHFHI